jgi:N-acetylmuramoyl-L-alanine amidase
VIQKGDTGTVPVLQVEGSVLVSVTGLCDALGIAWKWDMVSQKLSITKNKRRIEFVTGMPFYCVNDTLRQMAGVGPLRRGGGLYCAAGLCAEAFGRMIGDSIVWHGEDSTFEVAHAALEGAAATTGAAKSIVDSTAAVAVMSTERIKAADSVRNVKTPVEAIKTVVIDPGHGGMDPGAIGPGGQQEKDIVLDIALLVRDEIKKQPRLTVYMTREKDVFIPLQDRTKFANTKMADLFVSVHANSIEGNEKKREATKGFKVYFLSQAKNEDDKLAAMRENAVIKMEDKASRYDNLQDILINMAGNEYLRESQDFSIMIAETFDRSLKKIQKAQLGVGQANFWVLNGAYMPSVLVEVGFISNRREEESLKEKSVKKSIATGIYESIINFRKKYEAGL